MRHRIKWLFFRICIFLSALALSACTPARQEVQTLWEQTPVKAAAAHAANIGGLFYVVASTESMRPFLEAGDVVVVKPIPYEDVRAGMLANYQARWRPPGVSTVTHWAAAKLGDEWIMDGQANSYYEKADAYRMGRAEFRGQVVAIYTTRKKK